MLVLEPSTAPGLLLFLLRGGSLFVYRADASTKLLPTYQFTPFTKSRLSTLLDKY